MIVSTHKSGEKIFFQETNASGRSLRNWVTKYGGATGCLTITITKKELRTSFSLASMPPFLWLPERLRLHQEQAIMRQSDLSHCISKENIISVLSNSGLRKKIYKITYQDTAGSVHRLELMPKRYDAFERALNDPVKII